MAEIVILDNKLVTLKYHDDTKIIHHQFHGFVCGASFREVLMLGMEELKKRGATKWLSDDRKNAAIPKEDLEWGEEVWRPLVLEAGWKHWAIVLPEKTVGRMAMNRVAGIPDIQEVLSVELFDEVEPAYDWLAQQ